jgi:hypothetical protein
MSFSRNSGAGLPSISGSEGKGMDPVVSLPPAAGNGPAVSPTVGNLASRLLHSASAFTASGSFIASLSTNHSAAPGFTSPSWPGFLYRAVAGSSRVEDILIG